MENFKDKIILLDDRWWWRNDDQNLHTYNILKNETELLEKLKPYLNNNSVMVQAGGNCGMQIDKFAHYFDTIYTFEPDPINFYCLNLNLPYDNVVKIQSCLGNEHTLLNMKREGTNCVGSFHIDNQSENKYIPTLRIDDLNLNSCDLIQLDVEGFQYFVLMGSQNTIMRYRPVIVIEYDWASRYNTTENDIKNFLYNLNYIEVEQYTSDHIYIYNG